MTAANVERSEYVICAVPPPCTEEEFLVAVERARERNPLPLEPIFYVQGASGEWIAWARVVK